MAGYNELIINESNGRFYYKRTTKSGKEFQGKMKGHVYLRESAYNMEEEQRLIELDESSRGQPALKRRKLGNTSASFVSYHNLASKNPFAVDDDEDIYMGVSKPSKSNSSTLSKFYIKNINTQSLSLESITDEDNVIPQRKHSSSNYKANQTRGKPRGMPISKIFENEFAEEKSKFYSYIKDSDKLSVSSLSGGNKPEIKRSVCNKLKKFALSGQNFLNLNRKESENFKKNIPTKTKGNNEDILTETVLEKPRTNKVVSSKQSKLVTAFFPGASIIQDGCTKIVSSVFHQVKGIVANTKVVSSNKLLSKTDSQKADKKEVSIISRSTTVSNETCKSSLKPKSTKSRISVGKRKPNSKSPPSSSDTRNDNEDYYRSASEETEDSNMGSEATQSTGSDETGSYVLSSSYEVPRRHFGRRDQRKRDKVLIGNLMRHVDRLREEKSKKKLSIFQKLIKIFSRNKDSSINSPKKEKSSFREIIRKGLGFKKSIKVKHTNSVVIYREKRRKLFHEQKEFYEDSVNAYSNARMPVLLRNDKVLSEVTDFQLSSPIKRIIACTVSDGVFHERKRKLGQSRLGMKESVKDVGNDEARYSVNNNEPSSDIRGILKNK